MSGQAVSLTAPKRTGARLLCAAAVIAGGVAGTAAADPSMSYEEFAVACAAPTSGHAEIADRFAAYAFTPVSGEAPQRFLDLQGSPMTFTTEPIEGYEETFAGLNFQASYEMQRDTGWLNRRILYLFNETADESITVNYVQETYTDERGRLVPASAAGPSCVWVVTSEPVDDLADAEAAADAFPLVRAVSAIVQPGADLPDVRVALGVVDRDAYVAFYGFPPVASAIVTARQVRN